MSGRHIVELQQVLLKLQSAFGSVESSLAAADVAEVAEGSKVIFTPNTTPIKLLGDGFSQNASVVGPSIADVTLIYPLRTGGAVDTPGQFTLPLQCCGLVESESTDVYTYTPTSKQSEYKDCTIHGFSGSRDTNEAFKRILYNCMFNAKFTLDFRAEEAIGKVEFTGKGVYSGASSLASQVSITKSTASVYALKDCINNFFGDSDYDLLLFELDIGNEVFVTTNPTDSTGLGYSLIKRPSVKWNAIVYKDGDTTSETIYHEGTLGTISVSWGAAPDKITIATGTSKAQITECGDGDQDGAETEELSGIVVDNDFTVAVDTSTS